MVRQVHPASVAAGLAAVMLLASVAPVAAQLRYVDRHGVVHWVQTRQQIPPEYRDKAEEPALPHIDAGTGEDPEVRARRKAFERDAQEHGSQADFQRASDRCRKRAKVETIVKPGEKVTMLGTERERFRFKECMNKSGKPLE